MSDEPLCKCCGEVPTFESEWNTCFDCGGSGEGEPYEAGCVFCDGTGERLNEGWRCLCDAGQCDRCQS